MPPRITLSIDTGPLAGQEFIFEERTTVLIGKAHDCFPGAVAVAWTLRHPAVTAAG